MFALPVIVPGAVGVVVNIVATIESEIIPIIKWLAIDLFEVVVDIQLSNGLLFNTIEWRKEKKKVYLHKIEDNLDYQFDFDTIATPWN